MCSTTTARSWAASATSARTGRERAPGHRRGAPGQALVDFTFLAPILMLLFLGLVGLGVEVWAQLGLVAVAQEAAHAAAVAPDQSAAVDQGTTRGYQVGSGY